MLQTATVMAVRLAYTFYWLNSDQRYNLLLIYYPKKDIPRHNSYDNFTVNLVRQ